MNISFPLHVQGCHTSGLKSAMVRVVPLQKLANSTHQSFFSFRELGYQEGKLFGANAVRGCLLSPLPESSLVFLGDLNKGGKRRHGLGKEKMKRCSI